MQLQKASSDFLKNNKYGSLGPVPIVVLGDLCVDGMHRCGRGEHPTWEPETARRRQPPHAGQAPAPRGRQERGPFQRAGRRGQQIALDELDELEQLGDHAWAGRPAAPLPRPPESSSPSRVSSCRVGATGQPGTTPPPGSRLGPRCLSIT